MCTLKTLLLGCFGAAALASSAAAATLVAVPSGDNGRTHSFLLDTATNSFTDIEVPGAKNVEAWAINNTGVVTLTTNIGPFLWCENDATCPAAGKTVKATVHTAAKPLLH